MRAQFVEGLALLTSGLLACSTATLIPSSSTGDAGACASEPIAYCDDGGSADAFCSGDPDAAAPAVRRIPAGKRYPLNCTIEVPNPYPDRDGVCSLATACRCIGSGDGGTSSWNCKAQ